MFKAVNNLREQKGFTLIELLIVIAIIGILAAIAIPAFLGQREKAKQRSMEASARGMLSEVQAQLDDFILGQPMIFLDGNQVQQCWEQEDVSTTTDKNSCEQVFKMASDQKYTTLTDIMTLATAEHNAGKEEVSPYTGEPLVNGASGNCDAITGTSFKGKVVLCNMSDNVMFIYGFSRDGTEIAKYIVSSK